MGFSGSAPVRWIQARFLRGVQDMYSVPQRTKGKCAAPRQEQRMPGTSQRTIGSKSVLRLLLMPRLDPETRKAHSRLVLS
jgi:hypothetical protein